MSVFNKVYEKMINEIEVNQSIKNENTEFFLTSIFYSTILQSFKWGGDIPKFLRGLPDYIEECFLISSMVAYFEDNGEFYITPCYGNGILLDNGLYSSYTCIFRNGRTVIKNLEDIEICYNNSLGLPNRIVADEILNKCVNALLAIDMSLERAAFPSITFSSNEQVNNTIIGVLDDAINKRKPYALINSSSFNSDVLNKYDLFDNRAQDVLALWDIFVRYKNMFYTTFGVSNIEISKTERLTKKESESNTEMTRYGLFSDEWGHRVDWAYRIEEHFGNRLTCDINRNSDTVAEMMMTTEEKIKMNEMLVAPYLAQVEEKNKDDSEVKEDVAENE